MDLPSSMSSQFLEEEEVEQFPEDHFEDDDFYDSEFGSAIHDEEPIGNTRGVENARPLRQIQNLTTITEESAHQFGHDLANISFKPATNFLQDFDKDRRRVEFENLFHPDKITEEMYTKQYSWEPSILSSPPLHYDSRTRLSNNDPIMSTTYVIEREKTALEASTSKIFDSENRSESTIKSTWIPIRRANLSSYSQSSVRPDSPRSASPSLLLNTSPKIDRIKPNPSQDVESTPRLSLQETATSVANRSESTIKSTWIPIKRPNRSSYSQSSVKPASFQGVSPSSLLNTSPKIDRTEPSPSQDVESTPKLSLQEAATPVANRAEIEQNPILTPKNSPDFNATIISAVGNSISTPKDARAGSRKDLSILCEEISIIDANSPKIRPKNHEKSHQLRLNPKKDKVVRMVSDSLLSEDIDRALSGPECHTIVSDVTEIQQKLLKRINQAHSVDKQSQLSEWHSKLTVLDDMRKKNERIMELSARKRESRKWGISSYKTQHSKLALMPTIPESLSSTDIGRALSDTVNPTFVSNVSEKRIKLALRINAYSRNANRVPQPKSSLDGLESLKNDLKKQVDQAKFKKMLKY